MQIAILGAGHVGSTLGRLWHAAGHDVTFAARHATQPQALAAELGERAHSASVAGAVAGAEVVLVAVPGPVVTDVLHAAGPLDGHVMIDAANSYTNKAGRAIPVGAAPGAMAITPDGKIVLVATGPDTVTPVKTI